MYGSLDISTSGMIAQRTRMTVIASNLANINSLENSKGEYDPYLRKSAMFSPGDPNSSSSDGRSMGVHVNSIEVSENPLRLRYMPDSPHRDEQGNVMAPNIDSTTEWVNAMQASRAYEANVAAAETTKTMMAQILRLLA
ncbi:MAG: flagellar basal body rod protein FlgC [Phycisphaerales bacterium]